MKIWKASFAAIVVLGCLGGPARADGPGVKGSFSGSAVDAGSKNGGNYYVMTNSFDPLGIAGVYPGYLGFGLSGYGPGAKLDNNFAPWPVSTIAKAAPGRPRLAKPRTAKPGDSKKTPSSPPASRNLPRR